MTERINMKVTAFTIEGVYKLKSEEGDVLQIQPAAGWKTIRGAKAWAEKHGYEFEQTEKEEPKMAKAKAKVISVDVMGDGSVIAYYSTGNTKAFKSVDALPKTVRTWLDANGPTPVIVQATEAGLVIRTKDLVEEEPEAADQEVAQIDPESDQIEQEVAQTDQEASQTHREPVRRLQAPQVKSLPLDIVDAVVSGLLMATRLSLIALAYLLMGLASTCQAIGEAVEWLTPRAASLIDRGRAAWTETVRPAGKAATVWMAEAIWYIVI